MKPDMLMRRGAVLDGPCRYTLSREWDDGLPNAAWLLCNPSTADAEIDDPTCRRMMHFTRALGCGGFIAVNIWPLRATFPRDLWPILAAGALTEAMEFANDAVIELARDRAHRMIVAFGTEPPKRDAARVERLVQKFSRGGSRPLLCLGTNTEGWPLHPLARGKFAIPNDRRLSEWVRPVANREVPY
jgi:hypothetical protein